MTAKEKLKLNHPDVYSDDVTLTHVRCPHHYDYLPRPDRCGRDVDCIACWDREIPEGFHYEHAGEPIADVEEVKEENGGVTATLTPRILDSGARQEFGTGAVRDIQEGKGRCDLMPLDIVSKIIGDDLHNPDNITANICSFQATGDVKQLYFALDNFAAKHFIEGTLGAACCTMCLEVAIHFEEGAKKYGESNWQKGIPVKRYIDSAVRHYLKFLRGDKDEPHDRAFAWNLMCAIWTCKHKPELNDYASENKT